MAGPDRRPARRDRRGDLRLRRLRRRRVRRSRGARSTRAVSRPRLAVEEPSGSRDAGPGDAFGDRRQGSEWRPPGRTRRARGEGQPARLDAGPFRLPRVRSPRGPGARSPGPAAPPRRRPPGIRRPPGCFSQGRRAGHVAGCAARSGRTLRFMRRTPLGRWRPVELRRLSLPSPLATSARGLIRQPKSLAHRRAAAGSDPRAQGSRSVVPPHGLPRTGRGICRLPRLRGSGAMASM